MPERIEKFTPYNDGEHGMLIGYGEKVKAGQQIKKGLQFYTVEEVQELARGSMWSASLKATGTGRER